MRVSYCILLLIFILEFELFQYVSGSMVTMPASVAFAIITAAVKMKLILVKLMFAWRTMGKYRFRRSTPELEQIPRSPQNTPEDSADELLMAWRELESTAERQITFDFPSCRHGAMSGSTITNYESENVPAMPSEQSHRAPQHSTSKPIPEVDGYSKFVSSVIGSIIRNTEACHVLQEAILSRARLMDTGLRRIRRRRLIL